MTTTVLSVASRAVLEACESLGMSSDALLAEVGLSRDLVFDPDERLPADQADAIWAAAYRHSGDRHLGLRAAVALPFGAYRVLDFVVAQAPDLREALVRVSRYFALVDQRAELLLAESPEGQTRLVFSSPYGPVPAEAQEYTLAALVTRLRACAAATIPLEAIEFTFPRPEEVTLLKKVFGCALRFDCEQAAIVFPSAALDLTIPGADPALAAVLVAHAEHLVSELPEAETDIGQQLRNVLSEELRGGDTSMQHVARRLGASERTLGRRLQEHGRTYAEELSAVREQVAAHYLRQPGISLTEIAFLLGFSDQSAFTRAFKRWTNESPGAWRKRHQSGPVR